MSAIKLKSADGYDVSISATGATTGGALSVQIPGSIKSGTAVSASGTSVDFTGIPAWAKRITVMFRNVSTNGTSDYIMRLGNASTGIQVTGYESLLSTAAGTTQYDTTGILLQHSVPNASARHTGTWELCRLESSNIWVGRGCLVDTFNANNLFHGAGEGGAGGTLDRIRITTFGGTEVFDGGTINILYE